MSPELCAQQVHESQSQQLCIHENGCVRLAGVMGADVLYFRSTQVHQRACVGSEWDLWYKKGPRPTWAFTDSYDHVGTLVRDEVMC